MKNIPLIIALTILTGCSATYNTSLSEQEDTGILYVEMSSNMRAMSIFIDDQRVFQENNVRDVTINGIEPGTRSIRIMASDDNRIENVEETRELVFYPGQSNTIVLNAPPRSTGYYVITGVTIIGSYILTDYLFR